MWELYHKEGWAPKNWCFWTWCWRRLLRVPWTTRRSNQSILKEISPGCSLEGLMMKLKLQYFGHLMWRAGSSEKTLIWERLRAGGEGDDRRWDGWMASPTQWTWVWMNLGVGDGRGGVACCGSWGCKESDMTEWLSWTELNWTYFQERNEDADVENRLVNTEREGEGGMIWESSTEVDTLPWLK